MQEAIQLLEQGSADQALAQMAVAMHRDPDRAADLVRQMGEALAAQYERLETAPVHRFCARMVGKLSQEVAHEIMESVQPLMERTRQWAEDLESATRERLAREARAGITLDDLKLAARRGQAIIGRGKTPQERAKLAKYFIEAIGSLLRDGERAARVAHALVQGGIITPEMGFDWRAIFQGARDRASKAGMEESDRAWLQNFNSVLGSLRESVPGKREAGEPTPEQVERFAAEARAILRAGMASSNEDDFIDALLLLREFCPTDPPAIQSAAGAETRMFLNLGGRAKLTSVRALGKLGTLPPLRRKVLEFAASPEGEARVEALAAIMGGLRHNDFFPWLKAAMRTARTAKMQEAIIDALGRIANPEAADTLLEELAKCMKSSLEPPQMRRAKTLLTALGRIARSAHVERPRRNAIIQMSIDCVGERDSEISYFAAAQLFAGRVEDIEKPLKAWGARQLAKTLFSPDRGQNLGERAESPLGRFQPIVAALGRMGKEALPEVLRQAEPHATKFTPAFLAFAELMQKIGTPAAAPILETMIQAAILHTDDPRQSYLLKEKVRDAATGEMRELGKDETTHALLFALDKIGGDRAHEFTVQLADRVQAGAMTSPGGETSSFLLTAKRKQGTLGKIAATAPEPSEEEFPAEQVQKAANLAKGGMFSSVDKQIVGLNYLGRARRPETAPVIVECLKSKDMIVRAAAETALAAFVDPLPDPKRYESFLAKFFTAAAGLRGDALERLIQVIQRSFPKRPPYSSIYSKLLAAETGDGALGHRLRAAIVIQEAPPAPRAGEEAAGEGEAKPKDKAAEVAETLGFAPPPITLLDRKREYHLARQEWIKGGKQGPPPKPPE